MPAGPGGRGRRTVVARPSRWPLWLAALCLLGFGVRMFYLFHWLHPMVALGDAYYYHQAANLFASGRGWPDPYELRETGRYIADAQHPPLTSALLAVPSLLGFTSFVSHQVFSCLLGVCSIVVVALAGRRMAGPATGLVAAGLAAVYPGMWLNDPLVMSETTGILACSCIILAGFRFVDRRRMSDAAWLGLALAAVMLARAELALLALTFVVPLVGLARRASWRRRAALLAVAAATCTLAIAPWVAYNLERFREPEYLSTGLGSTLAVTHCPTTYAGPQLGWWSYDCARALPKPPLERSERDVFYRDAAADYIRTHSDRLPVVAAARLGRTWGFYHPWQQIHFDQVELRPPGPSTAGMVTLWLLEPTALAGVVVLRRRRVATLPLVAVPITLSLATLVVYGTTRFRAAAEPALVLLAAVAITAAAEWLRSRPGRTSGTPPGGVPSSGGSGEPYGGPDRVGGPAPTRGPDRVPGIERPRHATRLPGTGARCDKPEAAGTFFVCRTLRIFGHPFSDRSSAVPVVWRRHWRSGRHHLDS
ncbi:glycosyltransferase family 39 protein [Frankia sp. AgB32]|uniref:ArnT family glycosyltransferase n=1 Tax=Frankia sp. AgB32 TaxID=631119 RepID=UPI00200BF6D9|nr:glycosyltransferase family 39 protein [Frankia sp. AgB32]MCK9897157.1 glycosyltransferase family 39 protein [Frankia sp. AgB32]